jgi:tetratricopeptide (TPR) repeat protein
LQESLSLDAIGIQEGTNKSSLLVDYLRHYERIFRDFREDSMNIIEIGVYRGASLRAWSRFFPRATIVGIDIYVTCKQYASERVIIEIGSQSDLGFITDLCQRYKPKIIIDDGSHWARDVLFTFQTMFPFLLPGGFYVMEDLYLHYGESAKTFSRDTPVLPLEYIVALIQNMASNSVEPANNYGLQKYLFEQVDRIEIIRNAVIIGKKNEENKERIYADWWRLVEQTNLAFNWNLLSQKLLKNSESHELAAQALRRCIELEPDNLLHHYYLADVLDKMGDIQSAILEARRAVELSKNEGNRAAAQKRLDSLAAKARTGSGQI